MAQCSVGSQVAGNESRAGTLRILDNASWNDELAQRPVSVACLPVVGYSPESAGILAEQPRVKPAVFNL